MAAVQMRPFDSAPQSMAPHAQTEGLAEDPSVLAQVGILRHLFWDR